MSPVDLLKRVVQEHAPEDIWIDSPLIGYRMLGNTNRGEIGEEFVRRYLVHHGLNAHNGGRTSKTDLQIEGQRFEIKTASLGVNRTFQFNHIRLDRDYQHLLCLGVCPSDVVFNMWRKGEVAEKKAGKLVRMAEGQAVTYKLTKRLDQMLKIENLVHKIRGEKHE